MAYVEHVFHIVLKILHLPIVLFGYETSFLDVLIYVGLSGIVLDIVMEAYRASHDS